MKGITLISLILFLISVSGSSYSQNHKIDSLKNVFAQHPNDTVGLYALRKVARLYLDSNDYYNTIKTANQTIDLAKKLNNNFIIGEMYSAISDVYLKQDNYGENIRYSYMALKHYEYAGNIHRQADMFQVIGVARRSMGKFDEAAAAYKKAFELRRLINDKIGMAQSKNTLGQMLLNQNKVDSAQVLFFEALAFFEDAGDSAPWGLPLPITA